MAQTSQSKLVIPYCIELPEGLEPGSKLRIRGSVPNDSISFMVNFLCGKEKKADNALLVLIKVEPPSLVMLNSFINNTFGEKEKFSNIPFARGQDFQLEFVVEKDVYKVLMNEEEFCQRKHCISAKKVRFVQIEGSVELQAVNVHQQAANTEQQAANESAEGDSEIVPRSVAKVQSCAMYCPPICCPPCNPCQVWYCHCCRCTPCRCGCW